MTTDLANQITVEGAVPAGWELSIVYFTFNFNLKITLLHVYQVNLGLCGACTSTNYPKENQKYSKKAF